jgi:hypothetical protein
MKRIFFVLLFLIGAATARGQTTPVTTLTASGSSCATGSVTAGSALIVAIGQNYGTASFTINSNAGGNTISFYASGDGARTFQTLSVTPSNSTTTVTSSAASSGLWRAPASGYTHVCALMSTQVSGSTVVNIYPAFPSASLGNGSGGASGNVTNQVRYAVSANASGTSTAVDSTVCTPPSTNGTWPIEYVVTTSAAGPPGCFQVGILPDAAGASAVTYADAAAGVLYNPASALSLPTPTTLGNANAGFVGINNGSASTVTPATFTIAKNGGTAGATASWDTHNRCSFVTGIVTSQWNMDCSDEEGYINGVQLAGLASGLLYITTTTGAPSSATGAQVNTTIKTLTGCNTATYVYTPQAADCVAPSAGGTAFPVTVSGTVNSGGIPCFNSATNEESSAAIVSGDVITGGGAGACVNDSGTLLSSLAPKASPTFTGTATSPIFNATTDASAYEVGGNVIFAVPNSDFSSVAVGESALGKQTVGTGNNTAVGDTALFDDTSATGNTAVGTGALATTASGYNNTCVGYNCLDSATGTYYTAIGQGAGATASSGSGGLFLGAAADPGSSTSTDENVIGKSVTGNGSYTTTLGGESLTVIGEDSVTFGASFTHGLKACETSYGATSVNTGSATTTTGQSCLPANSIIDAVVYRVTTAITTAASFTVGQTGSTSQFCSTQSTLTLGATGTCVPAAYAAQSSAAAIVVTFNTTPGAGAIRIEVSYHTATPPTS